jgi:hypothetical protein
MSCPEIFISNLENSIFSESIDLITPNKSIQAKLFYSLDVEDKKKKLRFYSRKRHLF